MKHRALLFLAIISLMSFVTACLNADRKKAEDHVAAADELTPCTCGSISRLHTLNGIYLAGQPTPGDFAQARKDGVKTVINLRHPTEIKEFNEEQVVEAEGLHYVSIPFKEPAELTDAVFEAVRHKLKTAPRPILMHCGSANRVGAVWLPYRVLDGGLTYEEALAEAKIVGLKSSDYENTARAYIDSHR